LWAIQVSPMALAPTEAHSALKANVLRDVCLVLGVGGVTRRREKRVVDPGSGKTRPRSHDTIVGGGRRRKKISRHLALEGFESQNRIIEEAVLLLEIERSPKGKASVSIRSPAGRPGRRVSKLMSVDMLLLTAQSS